MDPQASLRLERRGRLIRKAQLCVAKVNSHSKNFLGMLREYRKTALTLMYDLDRLFTETPTFKYKGVAYASPNKFTQTGMISWMPSGGEPTWHVTIDPAYDQTIGGFHMTHPWTHENRIAFETFARGGGIHAYTNGNLHRWLLSKGLARNTGNVVNGLTYKNSTLPNVRIGYRSGGVVNANRRFRGIGEEVQRAITNKADPDREALARDVSCYLGSFTKRLGVFETIRLREVMEHMANIVRLHAFLQRDFDFLQTFVKATIAEVRNNNATLYARYNLHNSMAWMDHIRTLIWFYLSDDADLNRRPELGRTLYAPPEITNNKPTTKFTPEEWGSRFPLGEGPEPARNDDFIEYSDFEL